MLKSLAIVSVSALLVTGCAHKSADIAATYVSPVEYEGYSCRQIGAEASRVSARVSELTGIQDQKASDDAGTTAVALILFWPAAFFVNGDGGNATELARLKGEMEALEKVSVQKNCRIEFRPASQ